MMGGVSDLPDTGGVMQQEEASPALQEGNVKDSLGVEAAPEPVPANANDDTTFEMPEAGSQYELNVEKPAGGLGVQLLQSKDVPSSPAIVRVAPASGPLAGRVEK